MKNKDLTAAGAIFLLLAALMIGVSCNSGGSAEEASLEGMWICRLNAIIYSWDTLILSFTGDRYSLIELETTRQIGGSQGPFTQTGDEMIIAGDEVWDKSDRVWKPGATSLTFDVELGKTTLKLTEHHAGGGVSDHDFIRLAGPVRDSAVIGDWKGETVDGAKLSLNGDGTYSQETPEGGGYTDSGVWECRGPYLLLTADTINGTDEKFLTYCSIYEVEAGPKLIFSDLNNTSSEGPWIYIPQ